MNSHPSVDLLYRIAFLAIICLLGVAFTASATPSDEITRAVSSSGATDVKHSTPEQFNKAFAAVLLHVKRDNVPAYVSSAVQLRPDLADRIVVTAIRVAGPGDGKAILDNNRPAIGSSRSSAPPLKRRRTRRTRLCEQLWRPTMGAGVRFGRGR